MEYTTKSAFERYEQEDYLEEGYPVSLTIVEDDRDNTPTGILDTRGNQYYRVYKKNKVGFI